MQLKYIGSNYVIPQKMKHKKCDRQNPFLAENANIFCILPIANPRQIRYGKTNGSKGVKISGGKK